MGLILQTDALHTDFSENWEVKLRYAIRPEKSVYDALKFASKLMDLILGKYPDESDSPDCRINVDPKSCKAWFIYRLDGTQEFAAYSALTDSHSLLVASGVQIEYLEECCMYIAEVGDALAEENAELPLLDVTSQAQHKLTSLSN